MVQTRSQHRRIQARIQELRQRRRERENESIWSALEAMPAPERNDYPEAPAYRPNDHCKRHRLRDGEEATEVVTTYKRRKAKR